MTTARDLINDRTIVGELASTQAGAAAVFHRFGIDFCCHGQVALAEACASAGVDYVEVLKELKAAEGKPEDFVVWSERPLTELIDHVLNNYHTPHRVELPRLIEMARKVERVHQDKTACPNKLTLHLERMLSSLDLHMQKEEQVLFPLVRNGQGRMALAPIGVMEQEHRDHALNLETLRELTNGFEAPADACTTWRALYLGLRRLQEDLMNHIHLENNILFPRALRG